jgi:hypothetical protein
MFGLAGNLGGGRIGVDAVSEVDAATVLLPVTVAGGFGTVPPADFHRQRGRW